MFYEPLETLLDEATKAPCFWVPWAESHIGVAGAAKGGLCPLMLRVVFLKTC